MNSDDAGSTVASEVVLVAVSPSCSRSATPLTALLYAFVNIVATTAAGSRSGLSRLTAGSSSSSLTLSALAKFADLSMSDGEKKEELVVGVA